MLVTDDTMYMQYGSAQTLARAALMAKKPKIVKANELESSGINLRRLHKVLFTGTRRATTVYTMLACFGVQISQNDHLLFWLDEENPPFSLLEIAIVAKSELMS